MPRGYIIKAELLCAGKKRIKFYVFVAVYARVRSKSVKIRAVEAVNDTFPEPFTEIKDIEIYSEPESDRPCILDILKRSAGFSLLRLDIVISEKSHGNARNIIIFQKYGSSSGAVNSSAHCNHDLLLFICHFRASSEIDYIM